MNPYQVLDVAKDASLEDIKKAYRSLARETHPDLNPGDKVAEERFKQISVAHEILTDAQKRADYNEFGEVSLEAGFDADRYRTERDRFSSRFGTSYNHEGDAGASYGDGFSFEGLDDLFRQFGGASRGGPGHAGASGGLRMRGGDLESEMTLGFIEAAKGGERRLTLARPAPDGSARQESITVRIPPGVTDGGRLRIPGKGGLGIGGGPSGDLWLSIRVEPHPTFRRSGKNLEFDLPVTLKEALLGAQVEIPTLDGRATLTIPPGTNSLARLRLKGQGIPGANGKPNGDLMARIQIVLPSEVPDALRDAVESCDQEDPRKGLVP